MIYLKSVFAVAFLIYTAHFLGRVVLGRSKDSLFAVGIGLGVLAHLFFLVGVFGFFKARFMGSLVLASFIVTLPDQVKFWRARVGSIRVDWLLAALLIALSLIPVMIALCPPYAKDALVYHMFLPKKFLEWGTVGPVAGNMYSNFPLSVEMFFGLGLGLGLEPACGLLSVSFYLLFLVQLYRLLAGWGRGWAILGAFTAGLVPSLMVTAGLQYVDVAMAFYCALWVGAVKLYLEGDDSSAPWLIGIFAGLMFSTKYTGGVFLILSLFAWALGSARGDFKALLTFLLKVGVGFAIFSLPWLAKNLYYTHNPVYPFMYSVFGGLGWDEGRAMLYNLHLRNFGVGRGLLDYILLPVNMVFKAGFETPKFDGRIGYLFLAAFAVLLARFFRFEKPKEPREHFPFFCLAASLIYFVFWALTSQQMRFLLPWLAVFWPAWLIPVATVERKTLRNAAFWAVLSISTLSLVDTAKYLGDVKHWNYVLGRETRDGFLARMSKVYPCIEFINEELPDDAFVFMVQAGNRGYYMERKFYSDSVFEWISFKTLVNRSKTPEELRRRLRTLAFTHLLVSEKYLYKAFYEGEGKLVRLTREFFETETTPLYRHLTFTVYELH